MYIWQNKKVDSTLFHIVCRYHPIFKLQIMHHYKGSIYNVIDSKYQLLLRLFGTIYFCIFNYLTGLFMHNSCMYREAQCWRLYLIDLIQATETYTMNVNRLVPH
jgi:hypothetical protein